jgi:hypothetical protein
MKHIKLLLIVLLVLLLAFGSSPLEGLAVSQSEAALISGGEIEALWYVGHLDTPGDAQEVAVVGDYAYICDWGTLRIVDVSDPTTPVEVGSYSPPYGDGPCMTLAVAGNYVYTGGYYRLNILDVTNPAAPVLVGYANGLDMPHGMAVAGAYAYVVDTHDTGSGYLYRLLIFDVSSVNNPFLISGFTFTSVSPDVAVAGSYAYVANVDSGLRVIDVSNPYAPFEVGYYDSPGIPNGVTIAGNYAYLSESGYGFRIVDISNPTAPFEVSLYHPEGYYVENSAVAWGYAYLAVGETGVVMVDVSNPAAPIMAGLYNTSGSTHDVAVANGYVYAADGYNGLVILRSSFSISGYVTTGDYDPIPGVTITATGGKTSVSDAAGAYVFNDMLPETYTLTASKEGYNFAPGSLEVTLPPNAIGKNFTGELLITRVYLPGILFR